MLRILWVSIAPPQNADCKKNSNYIKQKVKLNTIRIIVVKNVNELFFKLAEVKAEKIIGIGSAGMEVQICEGRISRKNKQDKEDILSCELTHDYVKGIITRWIDGLEEKVDNPRYRKHRCGHGFPC